MLRIITLPFRLIYRLLHSVAEAHPAVYSFSATSARQERHEPAGL